MKNYYSILEIPITATSDEIKKAFRLKAVKYHPDKHFGDAFFNNKFIEIKEAYDLLSNHSKRVEYDNQFKSFFSEFEVETTQSIKEEVIREEAKEEQFRFDPYKPFYSKQDRMINETPQYNPKFNHWGEALPSNADFFILPRTIGKIISGFTTLTSEQREPSGFFNKLINRFKHTASFMGVNGFAIYSISKNRNSISKAFELNFNNVTDLLVVSQRRSFNFNYQSTQYGFEWSYNGKVIADVTGEYYDKNDNPGRYEAFDYWTNKFAEKYWTVYLLDKMEATLEKQGYLEFRILGEKGYIPFIKLGIGYISFIGGKNDTTYQFSEIKRVYIKGNKLFIEHKNYEKKFFLFESGNKNGIPLINLSNRQFFIKALELLIGWKFS